MTLYRGTSLKTPTPLSLGMALLQGPVGGAFSCKCGTPVPHGWAPHEGPRGGHAPVPESSRPGESELFLDNLLVRIHLVIEMCWWAGLAPWDFDSLFQVALHLPSALGILQG